MKLPILPLLALTTPILAQGDLLTLLRSDPDLSTLASLIQLTNLNTTLSTSNNITIVAPTNRAFSQVPRDIPEGVAIENRNSTAVSALLSNHVFQGLYPPSLIGDIPTFGQTLVNSTFFSDVQPFSGFTDGQYNGLVRNGEDVEILSGELSVSRVVEAVSPPSHPYHGPDVPRTSPSAPTSSSTKSTPSSASAPRSSSTSPARV